MTYIFISHSTKDNEFARYLDGALEDAGFQVWVDLDSINPGDRWLATIQTAIEQCAAMVVVMSKAGRDSEWVEREALLAMDLKKTIHTALIEDMPLPLHLINRQYTDFREDRDAAVEQLVEALWELDRSAVPRKRPLSPLPNQDNFFDYLAQLGEENALIARDLYRWSQDQGYTVEFGGKITPGFHVRVQIGDVELTVFSVWAYPRQPAAQVQFQYLAGYPPYDSITLRRSTLKSLNRLVEEPFIEEKADRRPTLPLSALNSAENLETFKQIVAEIIDNLRSG